MTIWIDLANSPHVLFFAPIVEELRRRGHGADITAREFAQTLGLAGLHGLDVTPVGRHGGRGTLAKGRSIAARALALRRYARQARPAVAVGHNSYAQSVAAWMARIPSVTMMDYEHTPANHVSFRLARRVFLPRCIPAEAVGKYGVSERRIVPYDGFKEQVYLEGFRPDRSVLSPTLPADLWDRFVVVVARPPADFAVYHRFENPLFEEWLGQVGVNPDVRVVTLPRTPEQGVRLRELRLPSVLVPGRPLDGANLVYHADLVVSAGGTMNREAAVLGVPAYSVFGGETAAVDRELERLGRLTFIRNSADLDRIHARKRGTADPLRNPRLGSWLVDRVLEVAGEE